jgi:hypothetical protein
MVFGMTIYVQAHLKAKPFRKKPFWFYDKLAEIFSDIIADGRAAFRAGGIDENSGTPSITASASISQVNTTPSTPAPHQLEIDTLLMQFNDKGDEDEGSNVGSKQSVVSSSLDADLQGHDKKKCVCKSMAGGIEALASSIIALTKTVCMDNAVENGSLDTDCKKHAINMLEDDIPPPTESEL